MLTIGLLSQAVQHRDTKGSEGTEQTQQEPQELGQGKDPPAARTTPVWAAVKTQQMFPSGVPRAQDPDRERSFPAAPQCSGHLAIGTHGHFGPISHAVGSTDLLKNCVTTSFGVTNALCYKLVPEGGSNPDSC